jgi:hypothetical protein
LFFRAQSIAVREIPVRLARLDAAFAGDRIC